jgi:hypothetical protein
MACVAVLHETLRLSMIAYGPFMDRVFSAFTPDVVAGVSLGAEMGGRDGTVGLARFKGSRDGMPE